MPAQRVIGSVRYLWDYTSMVIGFQAAIYPEFKGVPCREDHKRTDVEAPQEGLTLQSWDGFL